MNTDTEALRREFEAWFADGYPRAVERDLQGQYKLMAAQSSWVAFQAGYAAAAAGTATPVAAHRAVQLAATVAANNFEHAHAMAVLRQIANMPRRTREQRLASACVRFLDAIRAGEPSDG